MELFDIFVQGIGLLGVLCTIIAVQFNSHFKILLFKTLSELLFAVQLFFFGSYTGVAMNLLGILRNVIFTYAVSKNKNVKPWIIVFVIVTLSTGITTTILSFNATLSSIISRYNNYTLSIIFVTLVTILPVIAKTLTTIAYAMKNPHRLRMLNLPSLICWLTHDLIIFSIAGMSNNIFGIISIIVAEVRYRKIKYNENGSHK